MARPTVVPSWNTDGSNRSTPTSGQIETGWTVGQAPPSSWFNWFMFWVGDWCRHLNEMFTTAWTWTTKHTFSAGLETTSLTASDATIGGVTLATVLGMKTVGADVVATSAAIVVNGVSCASVTASGDVAAATAHVSGTATVGALATGSVTSSGTVTGVTAGGQGVDGSATSGAGVRGSATTGTGVMGSATAGVGVWAMGGTAALPLYVGASSTLGSIVIEGMSSLPLSPVRGTVVFDDAGNNVKIYLGPSLGWRAFAYTT